MLANSSSNQSVDPASVATKRRVSRWRLIIALPLWVFISFIFAQVVIVAIISGLRGVGVTFAGINNAVLETIAAACVYLLTFGIIVSVPWLVVRYRTTREDVGLTRLPSWMDIGLAPAGFVIYLLTSGLLMYVFTKLIPGFNAAEPQSVGFQNLSQGYEYVLAFMTLVVVAPVAEEAIFRGYLYGKLRKSVSIWLSVLVTSILFGLLHMRWDGGLLVGINVGIDVFALSIIMCSLREVTGSIWAGILLHMLKNGLAFYLLFINTALLSTIGG